MNGPIAAAIAAEVIVVIAIIIAATFIVQVGAGLL